MILRAIYAGIKEPDNKMVLWIKPSTPPFYQLLFYNNGGWEDINGFGGSVDLPVEIRLTGVQNGQNVVFVAESEFENNSSSLYINGVKVNSPRDYIELPDNKSIQLITYVPDTKDVLFFSALKKIEKNYD